MTQPFRLPRGGRIDREQVLHFRFDGREYEGHPGDTLASALLANGVRLVGRSFKYHRPRGIMAAGSEEANAPVTVIRDAARTTPNPRAIAPPASRDAANSLAAVSLMSQIATLAPASASL